MCTPPPIDMCAPRRIFDWQTARDCNERVAGFINRKSAIENLKSLGVPVRFLQTPLGFVFEKFVNRREHDPGAFGTDAHVEIEFVVEKINVTMSENAEKLSGHFEIVTMNDSVLDRKFRAGVAGNAIAGTGHDVIQDLRNRPENRNGEYIAIGDSDSSGAMHLSCLGAEAVEIICAAQLTAHSPVMIVIEIKVRQMRKVDVRYSERGMITWIVFRKGDIGAAAHVSRKKRAVKIDNLQSVVSEEQLSRDAVERQRFSKKDVIHSIGAIDRDLEMCVRATAKLI